MGEIIKKCDKKYFKDIISNKKNFEVRIADFDIEYGDTLLLKETFNGKETGRTIKKKVKYFLKTKDLYYFKEEDINKHGYLIIGFED